jgi:hypothetical protein
MNNEIDENLLAHEVAALRVHNADEVFQIVDARVFELRSIRDGFAEGDPNREFLDASKPRGECYRSHGEKCCWRTA